MEDFKEQKTALGYVMENHITSNSDGNTKS